MIKKAEKSLFSSFRNASHSNFQMSGSMSKTEIRRWHQTLYCREWHHASGSVSESFRNISRHVERHSIPLWQATRFSIFKNYAECHIKDVEILFSELLKGVFWSHTILNVIQRCWQIGMKSTQLIQVSSLWIWCELTNSLGDSTLLVSVEVLLLLINVKVG